ncbi:LAGLIDADG family homing endonuclease [Candidatus Nanohalovita haloferacivicina]|uniref:LAGLIDADG family homing endonuclease n=1 Tax=Candidatus Nanohalovita haloferacivicina TaxID=2978046 RepID=UPI00325F9D0A|nr:hypothetical protein HBNXNv_0972 [Candidatus Nanohalobia archaeon BNXNv]
MGLVPGNKVKHQVGVPEWVKNSKALSNSCLRGLTNTDGSIYLRSEDGYKVVHFKNRSRPLLDDFLEMCSNIGVRGSKAGKYGVRVAAQEEVKRFIEEVDPIKEA